MDRSEVTLVIVVPLGAEHAPGFYISNDDCFDEVARLIPALSVGSVVHLGDYYGHSGGTRS